MTCQTETPCSATLTSSSSPDKRVRYGLGMLLGVADFEQEQAWFLEQDRGHARTLHGCGVVGGLGVDVSGTALKVAPGMAIDALGRIISVYGDQCADLNAWLLVPENRKRIGAPGAKTLHVVLRYCECATDLQPVPGQPCRTADVSMSATRITASFSLDLEAKARVRWRKQMAELAALPSKWPPERPRGLWKPKDEHGESLTSITAWMMPPAPGADPVPVRMEVAGKRGTLTIHLVKVVAPVTQARADGPAIVK